MLGILEQFFKFEVRQDSPFGRGIFAKASIVPGEIICKMAGPLITLKEFFDKYEWNFSNPLQVGEDLYIDLLEPYVCVNHSCDPNAGIRNNGILFAIKNISVGDEIFIDYSTVTDDVTWEMDCECGSKICRKKIGDFQTIPHDRKEFYFMKNALTSYIKGIYY